MSKVLYPGSFDPVTKGHENVIEQASILFDEVIVAVMQNSSKKSSFFTIDERVEILKELYKNIENIKIVKGSGASVDVALLHKCKAIVRGIRGVVDFDMEMQLAEINRDISDNQVNTICLFASSEYGSVSSSAVKEILSLDKSIKKYVSPLVEEKMLAKRRNLTK